MSSAWEQTFETDNPAPIDVLHQDAQIIPFPNMESKSVSVQDDLFATFDPSVLNTIKFCDGLNSIIVAQGVIDEEARLQHANESVVTQLEQLKSCITKASSIEAGMELFFEGYFAAIFGLESLATEATSEAISIPEPSSVPTKRRSLKDYITELNAPITDSAQVFESAPVTEIPEITIKPEVTIEIDGRYYSMPGRFKWRDIMRMRFNTGSLDGNELLGVITSYVLHTEDQSEREKVTKEQIIEALQKYAVAKQLLTGEPPDDTPFTSKLSKNMQRIPDLERMAAGVSTIENILGIRGN